MADPYKYPGSEVLRNLPGLRDAHALENFEYEQSALRLSELWNQSAKGKFDLAHLKAIHRYIFQDVYDWAGEIRVVSIAKNDQMFALPGFIEGEAARIQLQLSGENFLRGLDLKKFVERIAYYFGEWNALHPLREGNGRTIRELVRVMTDGAGYEFDQMAIDNSSDQWNDASVSSLQGDLEPIRKIFSRAVRAKRA